MLLFLRNRVNMTNNDLLRQLRYALHFNDQQALHYFAHSGVQLTQAELDSFYKREDDEGYKSLHDKMFSKFLDGLIIDKRGLRENPQPVKQQTKSLTNNDIFKKLRIALKLKDEDIIETLMIAGFSISKSELNALFRPKGHKHFKSCGDQILRNFLKGLAKRTHILNQN